MTVKAAKGSRGAQFSMPRLADHPAYLALGHLLYLGDPLRTCIVSFLPRLYIDMELF